MLTHAAISPCPWSPCCWGHVSVMVMGRDLLEKAVTVISDRKCSGQQVNAFLPLDLSVPTICPVGRHLLLANSGPPPCICAHTQSPARFPEANHLQASMFHRKPRYLVSHQTPGHPGQPQCNLPNAPLLIFFLLVILGDLLTPPVTSLPGNQRKAAQNRDLYVIFVLFPVAFRF